MAPQVDLPINNITLIPISTGMDGKSYYGRNLMYSCSLYWQLWQPQTLFQVQDQRLRTPSNPISARWPHPQIKLKTLILYLRCTRFSKHFGFHPPRRIFPLSLLVRILVPSLSTDSFIGTRSHLYSMGFRALPVLRCSQTVGGSNPGRSRFTISKSLSSSSVANMSAKAQLVSQTRHQRAVDLRAQMPRSCKPCRRGSRRNSLPSCSKVTPTWEAGRMSGTGMRWVFQSHSGTWRRVV